jgi:hypothetical protein
VLVSSLRIALLVLFTGAAASHAAGLPLNGCCRAGINNSLTTVDDRTIQQDSTPRFLRLLPATVIGSALGVGVGWRAGGSDEDEAAIVLGLAGGSVGTVVGGMIASNGAKATRGKLVAGAAGGVLAGIALGLVTARVFDGIDPDLPQEGWLLGFSLGQGVVTAWSGSRRN